MRLTPRTSRITRRRVLGLLAASGVTVIGSSTLFEYAPWLDYEGAANQPRTPLNAPSGTERVCSLIRAATLAASSHNTQPWTFVTTPDTIEIRPDKTRQLLVLDSAGRELWISLGCALENLKIAAQGAGYATSVSYPDTEEVIRVRLSAHSPQSSLLLSAITERQNTRSAYDGQPLAPAVLKQLQPVTSEPGVSVQFVLGTAERNTVLEYLTQGNLAQYADPAFVQELIHWLRSTKKDALATLDGLRTRSSGNPKVPRWLGTLFVGAPPRRGRPTLTQRSSAVRLGRC